MPAPLLAELRVSAAYLGGGMLRPSHT
jgi:hypothetical protein